MSTVLVIAPHPDDEVLGVGGTLLRHLQHGDAVHTLICTRGQTPRFSNAQVETVQAEARRVHQFLELTGSHFLDFPAAELDRVPGADLAGAILEVLQRVRPDTVFLPHVGDIHLDHQIIFRAAMVAARPQGAVFPRRVFCYETVSETDWYAAPSTPAFVPNVFVDITRFLEKKLAACAMYVSQMKPPPHQRSIEALKALSIARGHAMNLPHAEAFMLVREILR